MAQLYPCTSCARLQPQRGRCSLCANARPKHNRSSAEKARRKAKWQETIWRSPRWAHTRGIVLRRDSYTCQLCGQPGDTADHDPPLRDVVLAGGDPYNPDGCRCLCKKCSGRVDGLRQKN